MLCRFALPDQAAREDTMRKSHVQGAIVAGGLAVALGVFVLNPPVSRTVSAQQGAALGCPVGYTDLREALATADQDDTTGLNNHYWAVVVNREGTVCAVAYSGQQRDSQWLLSRQIAAAKAFTANGLSLDGAPISSGQLYAWVQPGAPAVPLFGLAAGNPVSAEDAYKGPYQQFGTSHDPMIGLRVGGTITFGGGLGLFAGSNAIGGLGLSGDTACADHSTAWRLREALDLAPSAGDDRITLDNTTGHPHCPNDGNTQGTN
jgi:uncharacterized protein GlcG (DUF336 family)